MTRNLRTRQVSSDEELVERCLRGDQSAWEDLISRYERLVYSVARNLCRDPEDSADVFQFTCMDLYKGLAELRDIKALPAWLITVARRRAIAILKAKLPSDSVLDLETRAEDTILHIEREHAIERALAFLPARCRRLIDLLYFDVNQPSYVEISRELTIPVASIGPTRARCLEKLRKQLD